MKKVICIILTFLCFLMVTANAETDISQMSLEELLSLRQIVNEQIAQIIISENQRNTDEILGTIKDLFPNPSVAKHIRDSIGAFSTNDSVTQEKLDTVTSLSFDRNDDVTTLDGIQFLRNLEYLSCFGQNNLTEIPDCVGLLLNLERIDIYESPITSLPDSICNLQRLWWLSLRNTNLSSLPDDIGNLSALTYLNISYTKISNLPESIYGLQLDTFERKGLDLD